MTDQANNIDDRAAYFATLAHGGWSDAVTEAECRAWLEEDPRHRGAYYRAQAVIFLVQQSADAAPRVVKPEPFEPLPASSFFSRRRLLAGLGTAAIVTSGIGVNLIANKATATEYRTGIGERRRLQLAGNSEILLDSNSTLQCREKSFSHEITLLNGEAFCTFRASVARPVDLMLGPASIAVSSATFLVRNRETVGHDLTVTSGSVIMKQGEITMPIETGRRIAITANKNVDVFPVSTHDIEVATAWKEGLIYFQRTSLADASAAFANYSETQILIPDPSIASIEISGHFLIGHPRAFAEAVATALKLETEHQPGRIIIKK